MLQCLYPSSTTKQKKKRNSFVLIRPYARFLPRCKVALITATPNLILATGTLLPQVRPLPPHPVASDPEYLQKIRDKAHAVLTMYWNKNYMPNFYILFWHALLTHKFDHKIKFVLLKMLHTLINKRNIYNNKNIPWVGDIIYLVIVIKVLKDNLLFIEEWFNTFLYLL
jgi:hypothetical protein